MTYADQLQHEMETNIATLFLQIVFILCLCRLVGRVLQFLKQPPVVGEILAGILMGPTVMGQSKEFSNYMFPKYNAVLLKGISDLGITFFMFILGLEFAPMAMLKSLKKTWMIGLAGILLPFACGAAISPYMYEATHMSKEDPPIALLPFILFTGASMSFTAFPVLARILTANGAMTSQIGLVSMGVASVDDVLAWTVLAIATSVAVGGAPQDGAWGILIGIAWVTFLLVVVRHILTKLQPVLGYNNFVVVVFLGMCISAWFTQVLGLHAFFGGFVFGLCVPKEDKQFIQKFIDELEVVVVNFFVPLFFANTGLRTDLTTLKSSVGPVLLVWALATAGKMVPPLFLGKCRGYSWRFSFQLASLMNARGLMELIALSVALETRAFNNEMYSVFVVMALGTTFMAGPMFWATYRPDLDPPTSGRELINYKLKLEQQAKQDGVALDKPSMLKQPSKQLSISRRPEKEASSTTHHLSPEVEEVRPEGSVCRELPVEEMIDASSQDEYGYLFHGTLKHEETEVRKSIADVFSLPFLGGARSGPESQLSPTSSSSSTVLRQRSNHSLQPKIDGIRAPKEVEPVKEKEDEEGEMAEVVVKKDGGSKPSSPAVSPQAGPPNQYQNLQTSSTILETLSTKNQAENTPTGTPRSAAQQSSPPQSPQLAPLALPAAQEEATEQETLLEKK